jgi:hypothetical protein
MIHRSSTASGMRHPIGKATHNWDICAQVQRCDGPSGSAKIRQVCCMRSDEFQIKNNAQLRGHGVERGMYLPTWREQSINVGEYGLQAAYCQRPKRTLLLASAASLVQAGSG